MFRIVHLPLNVVVHKIFHLSNIFIFCISMFQFYAGFIRCGGIPMAIGVQSDMCTPALTNHGSDKLKREFLAPNIAGDIVGCLGVSETNAGSDVSNIETTAVKRGGMIFYVIIFRIVCVCMCFCFCACVFLFVSACLCMFLFLCACFCLCMFLCVCMFFFVCACFVCVCVRVNVCFH